MEFLSVPSGSIIKSPTGGAVLSGPGSYGSLLGPNYKQYSYDNYDDPGQLLRSAYQSSLDLCRETDRIQEVAFALLSAGIFRGERVEKADWSLRYSRLGGGYTGGLWKTFGGDNVFFFGAGDGPAVRYLRNRTGIQSVGPLKMTT